METSRMLREYYRKNWRVRNENSSHTNILLFSGQIFGNNIEIP